MNDHYSIYGLQIGRGDSWVPSGIMPMWRSEEARQKQVPVPIWTIQGNDRLIVVDTGFDEALTGHEWAKHFEYRSQSQALREVGVNIEEVDTVIITHLHIDHATGINHFPNAKFVMQRAEYEFWTGPMSEFPAVHRMCPMAVVHRLRDLNEAGRLELLDGDHELLPGLRLLAVGGHSPGLQMLSVDTSKGTMVLCSDAAYVYENIEQRWPVGLYYDFGDTILALERAIKTASSDSLVVPNHDIQMWEKDVIIQLA